MKPQTRVLILTMTAAVAVLLSSYFLARPTKPEAGGKPLAAQGTTLASSQVQAPLFIPAEPEPAVRVMVEEEVGKPMPVKLTSVASRPESALQQPPQTDRPQRMSLPPPGPPNAPSVRVEIPADTPVGPLRPPGRSLHLIDTRPAPARFQEVR